MLVSEDDCKTFDKNNFKQKLFNCDDFQLTLSSTCQTTCAFAKKKGKHLAGIEAEKRPNEAIENSVYIRRNRPLYDIFANKPDLQRAFQILKFHFVFVKLAKTNTPNKPGN